MSKKKSMPLESADQVEKTLNLFDVIDDASDKGETLTQRSLAQSLGIALGLTNSLIKRAAMKGLIKIRYAPARRYAYYLTSKGFQEKSRLVREYLRSSLIFFRQARDEYDEAFRYCAARGWKRVVLAGSGELAEIASLAAMGNDVALVAILAPGSNAGKFCHISMVQSLEQVDEFDAVLLTCSINPQATFERLAMEVGRERVLTPKFLRVSRNNAMTQGQ